MDWILDLLTAYTQHSVLQAITVLSPISTQITVANSKSSPACSVFNSRSLATASNSGDSSSSHAQAFLSGEYPTTELSLNYQLNYSAIFLSLLCRAKLNYQPSQSPAGHRLTIELSQFFSAGLRPSLYSLGADPTENTAPKCSSEWVSVAVTLWNHTQEAFGSNFGLYAVYPDYPSKQMPGVCLECHYCCLPYLIYVTTDSFHILAGSVFKIITPFDAT
jgi:hypothetical protein